MKHLILTGIVTLLTLSAFAQNRAEYDGIKAIKEIHDGWLVVRLPGFEKKMAVLDSLLAMESISVKARKNLKREKANTLKERMLIHNVYPVVFDSVYALSRCAFIYTHETEGFQKGDIPARKSNGEMLDSVYHENYFFATLQGAVGKPIHFTSKDHLTVAYPFPNNIGKPGSIAFLFVPVIPMWIVSVAIDESNARRVYTHVVRVNRKLTNFYNRKFPD